MFWGRNWRNSTLTPNLVFQARRTTCFAPWYWVSNISFFMRTVLYFGIKWKQLPASMSFLCKIVRKLCLLLYFFIFVNKLCFSMILDICLSSYILTLICQPALPLPKKRTTYCWNWLYMFFFPFCSNKLVSLVAFICWLYLLNEKR